MEKLGLNLGFILLQVLNFAIIFIVLRKWVFIPLTKTLEKRKQTIAQGLEDARIAAESRANAEKDAADLIAKAQAQAADVVRESTVRAETASRELRAVADAEIAKDRQSALAEIEQEKTRILSELRGQVVSLAIAASNKLIGASLDETRQRALLGEFFSGVKSGKVVLLQDASVKGSIAEVTSALPLTTSEQESVKKDLINAMGGAAEISFKVDPSILGGLKIRVDDRLVDGSVAGQLQELKQNLS